jgi:ferredoxin-NADP reductase
MAWGDDIVFGESTVVANKPACGGGLRSITVETSGDCFDSYSTPGQYIQIKENLEPETKAGFYALASPPQPGSKRAELLIKKTDSNIWFCEASVGAVVPTSPAMGKGFNLDAVGDDVDTVLLFAAGTGIAPIRAAIESGKLSGKSCTLYYGARRAATMAYERLFPFWEADYGVKVVPVLSQGGLKSRQGYVQAALKEDGVKSPQTTAALLCGMKPMTEEVKSVLAEAGVPTEKVLMNF